MQYKTYRYLAASLALSLATACGGSGGSNTETPDSNPSPTPTSTPIASTLTGVFLDSAVENIGYRTATHSGLTNSSGEFDYEPGETVEFFIGDLVFPAVTATAIVTPLTIANTTDIENNVAVNIARLLQTLDADGDASNGIEITDAAIGISATAFSFDMPVADFEANQDVIDLVVAGGQNTAVTALVTAASATQHLQSTLDNIEGASRLAGVWKLSSRPEQHIGESDAAYIILLPSSEYYFIEVNEIFDGDDIEYGSYTYVDGLLSISALVDLNAPIGVAGLELPIEFTSNTTFRFETDDTSESGFYTFTKQSFDGNGLQGLWTFGAEPENKILFAFGAANEYIAIQPYDTNDGPGFEYGNYSYDGSTLSISIMKDVASTLLADETVNVSLPVTVNTDTATLDFGDEQATISRID